VTDLHADSERVRANGQMFDLFVDCTYQWLLPNQKWDLAFEPCVTLLYEGPADHGAITVMDGPFFTIYPDQGTLFSVYSVTQTPRGRFNTAQHAFQVLSQLNQSDVKQIRHVIEVQIERHYPSFREKFRYSGARMTVRTRTRDMADARASVVEQKNRTIQVLSGKIDSIFFVADEILKCIASHEAPLHRPMSIVRPSPAVKLDVNA
jgi:hypothetical protein